jgi:hypothetical protein
MSYFDQQIDSKLAAKLPGRWSGDKETLCVEIKENDHF